MSADHKMSKHFYFQTHDNTLVIVNVDRPTKLKHIGEPEPFKIDIQFDDPSLDLEDFDIKKGYLVYSDEEGDDPDDKPFPTIVVDITKKENK